MGCPACEGTGKVLGDLCPLCDGEEVEKEEEAGQGEPATKQEPAGIPAEGVERSAERAHAAESWAAMREMKDLRGRAEKAEAQVRKLLAGVQALRADLAAAAAREAKLKEEAGQKERESGKALAAAEAEVKALKDRVRQLEAKGQAGPTPPDAEPVAVAGAPAEEVAETPAPAAPADDEQAPAAGPAGEGSKPRAGKLKKKEKKASQPAEKQAAVVASPPVAPPQAVEPQQQPLAASEKLAALVAAEERRLREEAARRERRESPDSDEEAEAEERERQRKEDEEREARKAREKAAAEEEARERARQKKLRAEAKREADEERRRLLDEEKKLFSPEDFEALQALRAEVAQPEAEQSPGEQQEEDEDDEEAILEREMKRAEEEAKALEAEAAKKSQPRNLIEAIMQLDGLPVPSLGALGGIEETIKASQRKALKEKLQAKRELMGIMGTAAGRRGKR